MLVQHVKWVTPEDAKQVDEMDVSADVEFDIDDAVPSASSGSNVSNADVDRIFAEIENLNTFTLLQEYKWKWISQSC